MSTIVGVEPLTAPDSLRLIGALNAELGALYPEAGAVHFRLDEHEVSSGRGAFLVARIDGEPVACGAVRKLDDETAEIKRMFVQPERRRQGLARVLLRALERHAAEALGVARMVLETGVRQPEAIALYAREGYRAIPSYGEYLGSALSYCMEKRLTAERPAAGR